MHALPNRIYKFKSSLIERLSGDVSDFGSILYMYVHLFPWHLFTPRCVAITKPNPRPSDWFVRKFSSAAISKNMKHVHWLIASLLSRLMAGGLGPETEKTVFMGWGG